MTSAAWREACATSRRSSFASSRRTASISSRSHSRTSVATWSLRERAVCRRLPASPTSAIRRRSMLRCTSSASSDQAMRPARISRRTRASPRSIAARSLREMMARSASMRAGASDASRSWRAGLHSGGGVAQAIERFAEAAASFEPLLIASVVVLAALSSPLGRLAYWAGCAAVLGIVLVLAAAQHALEPRLGLPAAADLGRRLGLAAIVVVLLLGYFPLPARAFSPALVEARLQALQARIRPHFPFNSLNAVLALIRRDPRRAERALEDLADLFRTLMSDARGFVRLADEIALLERYASLEQLRLGERLRFTWELDTAPPDALLPPLVLQPLLENPAYHPLHPSPPPPGGG